MLEISNGTIRWRYVSFEGEARRLNLRFMRHAVEEKIFIDGDNEAADGAFSHRVNGSSRGDMESPRIYESSVQQNVGVRLNIQKQNFV
ncbi:hypothetical protein D3C76_1365490 [compost metagenome]